MSKKRKKRKKEVVGTIRFADLLINAADKPNRSMPEVSCGAGSWESDKDYKRSREKQKLNQILSETDD